MATQKQKLALKNLVENGGNIGKAMRDAGYSKNTAKTPQKLTESKGWQELIDETILEKLVVKTLREGLLATKISSIKLPQHFEHSSFEEYEIGRIINTIQVKNETVIIYLAPDHSVRARALDKCLRIKGRYKNPVNIERSNPFEHLSDEEIRKKEAEINKMLKRYHST